MTKARDLANSAAAFAAVSATELGYVDGVTSAIQTQIDTKLASSTAATTYQAINTNVSTTELGYLDGVTSAIQTQLNQKPEYSAGKNAIINGDFFVNQRNFTSTTTSDAFGFDRWQQSFSTGTNTYTPQTFTPGSAPVAGYEGSTYAQVAISGQSATSAYTQFVQKIEDVRTLAGQTATVSFWAKATSGTPKIATTIRQNFGTGGSPSAQVDTNYGSTTLSTSWARYTATIAIPSLSGKTIGTTANTSYLALIFWLSAGSDFNGNTGSIGINNSTIQIWGVQVEAGSTATPFQTATGTKQGELAACQRYYFRQSASATNAYAVYGFGSATSTTTMDAPIKLAQTMRVAPTAIEYSGLGVSADNATIISVSSAAFVSGENGTDNSMVRFAATGLTQFRPYGVYSNNSASAYLGFSAEL